jgi:hypothetical protein
VKHFFLLTLVTLLVAGCTQLVTPTPNVSRAPSFPEQCPLNFSASSGQWRLLFESQAPEEVTDSALMREIETYLRAKLSIYSLDQFYFQEATAHFVQHPADPNLTIIAYDLPGGVHRIRKTYLFRRDGVQLAELPDPPIPPHPGYPSVKQTSMLGFVREGDEWSLYVLGFNGGFYSGGTFGNLFYRSRDNGEFWEGLYDRIFLEEVTPPAPLPISAELAQSACYDENYHQLTQFAWDKSNRRLYALTYPVTPTPVPTLTPTH